MDRITLLLDEWAGGWSELIVAMLWQSTLLALAVAALCRWMRAAPPAVRCWLWRLVSLKLLLMPFWMTVVAVPDFWIATPKRSAPPVAKRASVDLPHVATTGVALDDAPADNIAVSNAPIDEGPTVGASSQRPAPDAAPNSPWAVVRGIGWRSWLFLAWLIGIAWQIAGIFRLWRQLGRLLAEARETDDERANTLLREVTERLRLRRAPSLRLTEGVESPFVCGLLKPTLVIPRSVLDALDDDRLRAVLTHELSHVKRRDLLWCWVPEIAKLLWFFHPVAHWALFRARLEQELACDRMAMRASARGARWYAEALLAIASRSLQPAALNVGAGSTDVERAQ